jgi:hypothetical protein
MSPKYFACAAATAISLLSGAAIAENITFHFSGKVVYGAPMAIEPGTPIVGTYSYDTDTAPGLTLSGFAEYEIPAPHRMTGTVGGYSISADDLQVSVWNDYNGNVEDMVVISGVDVVVNGTAAFPNGVFWIELASAPDHRKVLKDTKLPSQFNVKKFDAGPSLTYGVLLKDGGPDGGLLQFTVDSIVVLKKGR